MVTKMEQKTLVKICGLRRQEDAEAVNCVLPDFAGFILSPGFRRSISIEKATKLRQLLAPQIRTVGVFVDASHDEIRGAAESGAIDMIQLHGSENDEYIRTIASLTNLPVIKAFRIKEIQDLEAASSSAAQWVLLDSGTGTGSRFDWDLLEDFLKERKSPLFPGGHPWLLAGGLSAANVPPAILRFCPTGVDVSSKVETDGWKDPEKIAAFTNAVRSC